MKHPKWGNRPWWMEPLFGFCLYMTFIYMPYDMFWKSLAEDREVWFGLVTLTGWWAKATEPLHWLIYALGAYGFWKMRPWMWPWAAVYASYVTISMLLFWWNGGLFWPCWVSASVATSLWLAGDAYPSEQSHVPQNHRFTRYGRD